MYVADASEDAVREAKAVQTKMQCEREVELCEHERER